MLCRVQRLRNSIKPSRLVLISRTTIIRQSSQLAQKQSIAISTRNTTLPHTSTISIAVAVTAMVALSCTEMTNNLSLITSCEKGTGEKVVENENELEHE